ncbi:tyrosine-protein phosphatase Lar-like isoform X2 [Halichondria panicea]|uniref:tyrosine-protein phosphatase Lar-like isoform X2 n=1 Tax=Halichondria panicea TaxID=6063 RepID=UPI00312B992F
MLFNKLIVSRYRLGKALFKSKLTANKKLPWHTVASLLLIKLVKEITLVHGCRTEQEQTTQAGSNLGTGVFGGALVALLLLLCIVITCISCCCYKRRMNKQVTLQGQQRSCKGCTTNDVRLQYTVTGRVEVCRGGRWYSVCTPSNFLANVVCRQLDYCDDRSTTSTSYSSNYYKEVDCAGHESDLSSCSITTPPTGSCSQAVVVDCQNFNTPNYPTSPSISIRSSTSIRLRWYRPSTSNCRSIDGYRVTCTAPGCSSLSVESTTQTTHIFYSAYVTSCNYRCCIRSYNNAESSSSTCPSLPVPGTPNSVQGTVQSPQSVRISWSRPSTNYQHITGYRVSYNNQEMQTTLTSLTINGLTLTTYTFYVSANSVAGWSQSRSTTVTIAPPSAPPQLSATNPNSTSFILRWGRPSSTYGHPYSFTIRCDETSYSTGLHSIATDLNILSYTVSSLQPNTMYRCCVSAVNNAGESTTCVNKRTLEGAPSGYPVNLHHRVLNPTVIMLSWTELPYQQRNGIIRHYEVRVCQIEPVGQCEDHQATGTTLELSLHPHYRYSWTVAAYTVARGPYSQSLPPFQMPEDTPSGSPANVRQRALNSTAVLLSWIEPPYYQRNGIIRHYEVRVCQIEPEGQCEDHKAKAIGTSLELSLHPHYRYSWTVAAYTVARGPYSQSLPPFQMPEDTPSGSPANVRQRALNSTAVLLSWIEPPYYQRNGIIRHYEVRVCQIEPEGQCEDHKAKAIGTSLELSLHPHYRYSWTVAAYTVARGPYSQSLPPFQMPEDRPSGPPQNVRHGSLRDSSVQLFWSPPPLEDQNGIITRYNMYILNADNIVIARMPEVGVMTTIESLEEFTTFWFQLSAVTAAGEGPHTVYGPVTTAIGVKYGILIGCGAFALVVVISNAFLIVICLCRRKKRQIKDNAKHHSGTKNEHQSTNEQKLNTTEQKAKTIPSIPTRRYLEDDDFMVENFDGQPAIPSRTAIMDQVSVGSQRSDDEPAVPPRSYLLDNEFVQSLEVRRKDEPDLEDEEKIYQPLIPPRRYEESCQDNSDVYQTLTSNRSKGDSREMHFRLKRYNLRLILRTITKRAEQSVYEMVTVGASKDGENIETVPNNSEGHYQPLMKREEPSDYQPISTCISRGQTSFVMQSESTSEEGHYQALESSIG